MSKSKLARPMGGAADPPPSPKAPPRVAPVVVTLVFDPESGQIAITPVFQVDARLMIHVLQKAAEQVIAFAAVENARRQDSQAETRAGE